MFTSSGSMGGHGGDAKTIISPNTLFGDIINIVVYLEKEMSKDILHQEYYLLTCYMLLKTLFSKYHFITNAVLEIERNPYRHLGQGVDINGAMFKILSVFVRAMMGELKQNNIDIHITSIFKVDLIYVQKLAGLL